VRKGEHALLGAGLFFVAPGAAESRVEAVLVERLPKPLGFPDVGMHGRAVGERVDAFLDGLGILVHDELHAGLLGHPLAHEVHVAKLPRGVDVQKREGRHRRVERLARQVQHDRAVLADGVEHHRLFGLGDDFAKDVNAFGLESLEMGE
jgi:hypothetical protein